METSELDTIYGDASSKIPLKNSLGKNVLKQQSVDYLVKEIKKIPEYQTVRTNDIELILRICNIIEEFDLSKLKSVDTIKYNSFKKANLSKKEVVIDAFQKALNLTVVEKTFLDNSIQFLHDHHKILGEPSKRKVCRFFYNIGVFFFNRIF